MECLVFSTIRSKAPLSEVAINKIVEYVLRREHRPGSLSIHLIADTKMRRLQRVHRGKNTTTDVLSFATQEGKWNGTGANDLGDIFLSVPTIRRQAKNFGVLFEEECARMLIHGILHILGYDHNKKTEAKVMFEKQEKYLKKMV